MTAAFGHVAEVSVGPLGVEALRCAGKITRTLKPAPNTCEVSIYNLSAASRATLEELRPRSGSTKGIPVQIRLGYQGQPLAQVWLGDLRTVLSVREPPEWRTTIASGDGERAFRQARISTAFGPGVRVEDAIRAVVRSLHDGLQGAPAVTEAQIQRAIAGVRAGGAGQILAGGIALHGPASRVLSAICDSAGLEWSIQDGTIQIVKRGAAAGTLAIPVEGDGAATATDAELLGSNLIGSPDVDAEGVVALRLLISPDVVPGALLALKTERVKGLHRIEKTETEFDTEDPNTWAINVEAKRYG